MTTTYNETMNAMQQEAIDLLTASNFLTRANSSRTYRHDGLTTRVICEVFAKDDKLHRGWRMNGRVASAATVRAFIESQLVQAVETAVIEPKTTCLLPWSPEQLAQIRRERVNFDEENMTASLPPRPHFILCEECDGKGQIFDDGLYRECPVCDGTPMITFELVKQYATQIDEMQKRLRRVESRSEVKF